ncbi:MAG: class I SAM-dependent methyltransferase [Planctomycetota bacterium]
MGITLSEDVPETTASAGNPPEVRVTLADGAACDLGTLDRHELLRLQWQEEREFARRILDAPKGSTARAELLERAYDTVIRILTALDGNAETPLAMGVNPRYERLIHRLLVRQKKRGLAPSFFEIGHGSGILLERISRWGFPTAGIEVSREMHEQAHKLLGPGHDVALYLGGFLRHEPADPPARYSLVFWNDVFEHVPPDEILDYLKKIHRLLAPGGQLVTITPNWHTRPWDVTRSFCPVRTEAAGLHLKEYTLRQVTRLLRAAGFASVATPLTVTRSQTVLLGRGLAGWKRLLEPCLEFIPYRAAHLLCRGFGLSTTIARKPPG